MKSATRIPSLDGIRAVSILFVIYSHFSKDYGWGDPLDLGSLGVRIFFVISGFLITGILLQEMSEHGTISLPRFYFRRTLRIFPAFYFYLGCMLIAGGLGWADLSLADTWSSLTYTSNYVVGSLKHIVAHTWSLSTEEQFYLVWPVALLAAGRRRAETTLIVLMMLAEISSRVLTRRLGYEIPAFFNTPIGVGCMLALLRGRLARSGLYREWIRAPMGAFTLLAIIGINYLNLRVSGIYHAALPFAENVAIAVWIDWLTQNLDSAFSRTLNTRALIIIGVGSYSLYLWQQPFLHLFYSNPALLLRGPWRVLSNPLLRMVLIATCGCCSYLLVERPFLRLRAHLERRLFPRRPLHERLVADKSPEANSAASREASS